MSNEFTYGEQMFKTTYKYLIKVKDTHNEEHIVPIYEGFVCPKCGKRIYFSDKMTGKIIYFGSNINKEGICLDYSHTHSMTCGEPLYKYICTPVVEKHQKHIGNFRNSPVSLFFNKESKKHTNRTYKGRYDFSKYYRLKNDWCPVEPIYKNDYEEEFYDIPVVKFRKCNPKMTDGTKRSSGWKSNKNKIKQWN